MSSKGTVTGRLLELVDLEEAVGLAGLAYTRDDLGLVGGAEIDDGDACVGDHLCEARSLRLWSYVVLWKGMVVCCGGEKLIRHERW